MRAWSRHSRRSIRAGARALLKGGAVFFLIVTLVWPWGGTPPSASAQETGQAGSHEVVELNDSAARDISTNQTHRYRIRLPPEHYFRLNVTASGIDFRATVSEEEGQVLARTACSRGEPIQLAWIADRPGAYGIEISACEADAITGSYQIRVEEKRPATMRDRTRVAAGFTMFEAEELRAEDGRVASEGAVRKYEEALGLWRAAGDRASEARTLRKIAEALQKRGEKPSSLQYLKQAFNVNSNIKDPQERIRILNDLGALQTELGNYKDALAAGLRALELSRANKNAEGEAQALSNLGMTYYELSEIRKSLDYQQSASRIWESLRNRRGQAQALLRMGYANIILGEAQEALAAYQRALSLYRATDDYRGQAVVLTALGGLYSTTGGRQEGLNYYNQAMALSRRLESAEINAPLYSNIGLVYYELGELDKALWYMKQGLELYHNMSDRWGEAALNNWVGVIYHLMGDEQQAIEHYKRGLSIARSLHNAHLQSASLREMGAVYDRLGEKQKALSYYKESLALSRSAEDPRDEADALNNIGRVYESLGRGQEALSYFNRALPLTRAVGRRFAESVTLFNIAHVQRDLGRLDEAKAHIEAALGIVESLRTNVASPDLRTSYFATVRRHYELYIDVLMRQRGVRPSQALDALAFEVSERARARSLLETLAGYRDAIRQGVDPELVRRERALRQQLNAKAERQTRVLGGPHDDEEAASLAAEIESVTAEHGAVEAEIRARSPHYAALTQPQPLGLEEIQRRVLDDETVLLEYALGDERSYVWAVTRAGVAGHELPGRARIEEAARRLYALLTARQGVAGETAEQYRERAARSDADYWREAVALGDMILGPVAGHLTEGRRLLVVADGALQYVPFGALTAPRAEEVSGAGEDAQRPGGARPDGDAGDDARAPLFTRHEIVSLPSASILPALRGEAAGRAPAAPGKSVAVFADPVFDRDDPRVRRADSATADAGAALASADAVAATRAPVHRAVRDVGALFGGGVPRLLASREEADAITAALPPGEVEKVTDFGASRAVATGPGLARHRVIHFATHGILDSERPEMSGIILSLVNERGESQDGFLSLEDIYNLDLPADLVVLSACNTALGREVRGEGLIGLTRGFMYAGAGAVVASLWKVDDEATAELMKHFYAGMFRRGLAPPAALRQAQLAMWRQKRWRAPYYWAAFIIQGQYGELKDAGARPTAYASQGLAAWGGVAAAISFAALCAMRLRRRRRNPAGAGTAKA